MKEYQEDNKETIKQPKKQYREDNQEHIKELKNNGTKTTKKTCKTKPCKQ